MDEQFRAARRIVAAEFRVEVAVAADVDAGFERAAILAGPLGHLEHDRGVARHRPDRLLGAGAVHLLVRLGVAVREADRGGVVDLLHAAVHDRAAVGHFGEAEHNVHAVVLGQLRHALHGFAARRVSVGALDLFGE